jgi:hypothetical protein
MNGLSDDSGIRVVIYSKHIDRIKEYIEKIKSDHGINASITQIANALIDRGLKAWEVDKANNLHRGPG